jgi:hypothetical protein
LNEVCAVIRGRPNSSNIWRRRWTDEISSKKRPHQYVARVIREAGIGPLLFDLLTAEEEAVDMYTRRLRFDIDLLADRLVDATKWIDEERRRLKYQTGAQHLSVSYFGASTGAVAAARLGESIGAVVSRGGRPDLAGDVLPLVAPPTLLIVGGADGLVIELNGSLRKPPV